MEISTRTAVFQEYLREIRKSVSKGDYTEMTLRTPLENFIKGLSPDYDVTHEAKRLKALGAPDFTAYRSGVNIGYVEAKDLGKNLDEELESKQLKKYRESINNIILTDYRRFILIRGNQAIFDQSLFSLADLKNPKSRIREDNVDEFVQLTDTFFGYSQPTIRSAKLLAEELAKKTKLLKDLASEQLEEDLEKVEHGVSPSPLYDFYEALNELIREISIQDCADAYAQTIAYGLFLAKINEKGTLDRDTAASHIPRNIKIIRKIFSSIAGDSLPSNVSWIVDALIKILNASKTDEILSEIDFRGKKDRDPFTFFYEDFLASYEPEKKKHLGVYYTPRPVVSFIVKSVNQILKNEFDMPMGFAEEGLTVLDPAVGTGTFLWLVYLSTLVELKDRGLGGLIPTKIKNHILRDFYGFELLITPYIIAHLKLTTVLKRWFYEFEDEDRIQAYLTNTLEPFETHTHMPFFRELTEESETADELKVKKPIFVVLGNPPYSVASANKGIWIDNLLKNTYVGADGRKINGYYTVDEHQLDEKNPKMLQDDYVKFIRFAQWKIDTTGEGIIGLITSNGYIDNVTFRGMRQSLAYSFNRIYVLNLHGSTRRNETTPDGKKDENVFDIMQGVAIALYVRSNKYEDHRVFYADFFGSREFKYSELDANNISTIKWQEISPRSPDYFFVPIDLALEEEYGKFWKITEIFSKYSVGVTTHRDKLTVKFTTEEMLETLLRFAHMEKEEAREFFSLGKDTEWSIGAAQDDLIKSGVKEANIVPFSYRPFDIRYTYYTGKSSGFHTRPRAEIMSHLLSDDDNIALVSTRQLAYLPFQHVFVSKGLADYCLISTRFKERSYVFPLYLHSNDKQLNLRQEFVEFIKDRYPGQQIAPFRILAYMYAILHSPTYRELYSEFLKKDFPRIPFSKDYEVFKALSEIGERLITLHLVELPLKPSTRFDIQGTNTVQSVKYGSNKVYINNDQYFDGISEDVWTFYIGGYQVLDKWLKSRKGRELSSIEIEHFLQVVEVVKKTIECMKEIDGLSYLS